MTFRFSINIFALFALFGLAANSESCQAQEETALSSNPEIAALQTKFKESREEFRDYVKAIQQAGFRYMNSPSPDDAFEYSDEYDETVKEGNALLKRWQPIGLELFDKLTEHSEKVDDEMIYFICKLTENLFADGQFEKTYDIADKLVKHNPDNKFAQIFKVRAGILTNRFGKEVESLIHENKEHFQQEDVISDNEKSIITNLYVLGDMYKAELELRKNEAEADDLPLIMLETSKGNVEIELFENEAPETVGNFVSLVEKKHYDNLLFHTAIDKTAVETGAVDEKFMMRKIGYQIYTEEPKRNIFAGSVVMVSEQRNSGAARFFIALAPLPGITGSQTVLGRVKTGMDVVHALNKTHKMEDDKAIPFDEVKPDKIISAKVMRKRDHEYAPNKVRSENEE